MAGVKRALSEMFPNEEVEEEEDGGEPDVKKNLMDAFVQDTPVKGVGSLEARPEHMKVYLRVRPLTKAELAANENQNCLEIENELTVSTHAPKDSHYYKASTHGLGKTTHKFTFSKIFGESTSQKAFFDETMLGMVKDFVDGQNCLVFSYGVTNAGKTYTIQGNPKDAGLLPRALDVLFNSIEGKQWERMDIKPRMFVDVVKLTPEQEALEAKVKDSVMKMSLDEDPNVMSLLGEDASSDASRINNTTASSESSIAGHTSKESESLSELMEIENRVREETAVAVEVQGMVRFSVWISFAEVYNEHIFDLLEEVPRKKTERRKVLKVSEDRKGSPYIKGLKYINVRSADEAYKLMTIGQRNLRKACTKLNHNSSRSHCIFNIKVLQVVNTANPHVARVSMLTLCDLAGSERCTKTLATGERLKEAGNINTSLHTLGRCLENLRYNQSHKDCPKMIPFREGKLTRLFQNFFCGKGKAAMIVNVNQCASMFDETFHVFKFSSIAKQIVVVQKPEPRPKLLPLKGDLQSSSAAWANPAHRKTQADTDLAVAIPLPVTSDDELDDSFSEVQKLHETIAILKERLKRERKQRSLDELRIREEVCEEMTSQMVKIEMTYCERLREQEEQHEERLERKMELLRSIRQPSVDRMEDAEDEWVSSVLLHAEKTKVEIRDRRISELEAVIEQYKQRMASSELVPDPSESTPGTEQASSQTPSGEDTLAQQVAALKEELKEKEQEIRELNETLNEAGDTFMQKEKEIEKLQEASQGDEEKLRQQGETIRELRKLLEESQSALEVAQEKLTSRDIQILDLHTSSEELQERLAAMGEESKGKAEELAKKLQELQATVHERDVNISSLKEALETKASEAVELQEECRKQHELQNQIDSLKGTISEKEKLLEQTVMERDILKNQKEESVSLLESTGCQKDKTIAQLHDSISQRDVNIASLKEALETKTSEAVELQKECQKQHELQNQVDSLKGTISEKDNLLEQTVMERDILKNQKEESVSLLESTGCQKDKTIAQLQDSLTQRDVDLQKQGALAVELKGKLEEVTSQLEELRGVVKDRDDRLDNMQKLKEDMQSRKDENERLRIQITCKEEELESLKEDTNKLVSSLRDELIREKEQNKDLVQKIETQESGMKELRESLRQKDAGLQALTKVEEELAKEKADLQNLQKIVDSKEKEMESLKAVFDEHEKFADRIVQLEAALGSKEKQIIDLEKTISESGATMEEHQKDKEKICELQAALKEKVEMIEELENVRDSEKMDIAIIEDSTEEEDEEITFPKHDSDEGTTPKQDSNKVLSKLDSDEVSFPKVNAASVVTEHKLNQESDIVASPKHTAGQIDRLTKKISRLESEIATRKNKLREIEDAFGAKEREVTKLRTRLKREQEDFNQRELALIHGYTAEVENYKAQIVNLKVTCKPDAALEENAIQRSLESHKDAIEGNEKFKRDLLKQLRELQLQLDQKSSALVEAEQSLTIAKSAAEDLETRLAAELDGHSTAKILVDQLRKDLKNAHNSVQRESEQKGKEIEALQLEVAKSRGEMAIKAVEAESFKDKLEDMMNQREKKHTSGLESDQRSPDLLQEKIASCINDSVVEFRFHEVNFRIEELQQENLELKKQNNILVEKTKDSKCNKAEMGKAEIKRILEEKIQDLQCKNTAIQTELESKNAEFIELKGKLEEQEKRCRELTDDLEKYSDQVEELTVVKSSLTTMVDQVTEQLGDRDQKVSSLQMEVQALSKALEEGKASVVDLTEQLDKIKGQQETGKAEMGAKMSGYAQEVLSLQTAIEEGKAIIEDLTEKLVLCKNDKEAYDKERDEMQKTLANKDVLLAEIRAKLEDELVKMDRLEKEAEAKAECQKNRTEQLLGNISSLKTQVDEKQREAEYVQKSLSEKNSDIETLNDKISSLEADNEGLVAKLDMLKEMADSESVKRKEEEEKLQKCLQEKDKELQNLNTKITSLEEDVDELVNKLDTANDGVICKDEQIEKLQKEVACFVKEISKKEKLSEDLQDEVKSLRLEISEKNQSVGGKVAQLTETVNKKNTELELLKEEVETLSKVIDTKSSEVDDLTKEAEIEKAELMKVIKDKTDLEREISEKNELVLQLETEKSVLERELSGKLSEWTSEQETLVKTLAEKEALLTEIKGRLEVEIAQVEGVEKASKMKEESQENKLSQLSAELNRLNADRNTEIKKLEQGLCERDVEVKALDSKVSGLEEEVRRLEKEKEGMVAAATGTAAEIEKLQKELSEKEKATELLNSKVSILDLNVSELVEKLDAASSSIRQKDENIQMLSKELEDLTKTVERKEKASQELTEEVKSLREEISEKNLSVGGKVAQLTETVDKKNKELEDLKEEVETLSKVIDTKSAEIDDLTKAIRGKTCEIERLGQTLSEVQSEAEKNHKLVQELQGETTQLKADIQEKQCCIEQQQTEISELSSRAKQIDLLKSELVESRDKLGVASAELKNKINETMSLEKDMCYIKDKLCVSQESIDELKTTVEFLKAESEAKDNKIEDMNGEMEKLITEGVEKWEKIVQLEKELAESAEREETEHEEREKLADSSLSEGAKNVSQKLKEKEQEMEQLWICLSEKETDTDLLQEEIDNLKSKVDDFENQLAEKCRMLSSKQLTIGELQQKLSDMQTKVLTESQAASAKEQKLQKQIENLRIELEEKCQAEQKLCAQVKELEKDLAGLRENIESKSTAKDGLCELEKELSECKQQLVSSENTAENLKVRILELEAEVSALASMEDGGGHSVARNLRRQKIEAEKSKFEAECALNEALQEMESLRKKLAGHLNPARHSVCEKPLLLPKKTVTLCLGKSSALLQNEEYDEQENANTESSTATTSEKLAKRLRDSTCHNELNKSQSREQALRGQLHQASETIREQNERLATLETQLQDKVTELEHAETRLKQLQDSARLQKTKQSDTIEEVETLRRDVKALQDELAKKEVRLATRNASVDQLMTQLEKDRNSYELAMKDAVANEKVMEDLRAAIELQEDTMAKQDTVITAREAEIAALKNELDELTQRYDELNEKDTSSRRQIAEISRSNSRLAEERESHNRRVDKQERLVAKLRQEKDELYVQLAEAKDEIKDLQKSNKDSNIEITLLETNVSEKATKLAETEACLKDATSNLASMAARLDEAETRLSQSQGGLSGKHADSAALSDLKKRLKEKEAAVRSLEKEVSRLQGEIFNIGAKKEEELQVWRDQRDQLVGSLEALMKKQSLEIKQLREERGDNSHKENIKFEHEREEKILTQKQLSTVQRAKDQIISELKETNTQLQGQVTAIQSGTHHGRHRVASVTSDDLPPDEGTPTATKPKKRGRKRRSQEDIAPTEPEEGSKPATRSTRASKRKAMNRMEELKTNVQSSPKSGSR